MAKLNLSDQLLLSRSNTTHKFDYETLLDSLAENIKYKLTARVSDGSVGSIRKTELSVEGDDNSKITEYIKGRNVELKYATGSTGLGEGAEIHYNVTTENAVNVFNYEVRSVGRKYTVGDKLVVPNGGITSSTNVAGDNPYEEGDSNPQPVVVGDILTTRSNNNTGQGVPPEDYGIGCTVRVDAVDEYGVISLFSIDNPGIGYAVGEVLTVLGFANDSSGNPTRNLCTITVDTVGEETVYLEVLETNDINDAGDAHIELNGVTSDGDETLISNVRLVGKGSIVFDEETDTFGNTIENAISIRADKSQSVESGATIIVSSSNPKWDLLNPDDTQYDQGTLWYNTIDGRLYVLVYDENSLPLPDGGYVSYWIDASPSYINEDKFVKVVGNETINGSLTIENDTASGTISADHFNIAALSPLP